MLKAIVMSLALGFALLGANAAPTSTAAKCCDMASCKCSAKCADCCKKACKCCKGDVCKCDKGCGGGCCG